MSLNELIKQERLETIADISLMQITDKLQFAFKHIKTAETLFKTRGGEEDINKIVYLNMYNGIRLALQAFVLSKGYRTKGKAHHKTLIAAASFLIKDESLELIFINILKMSRNRNKIDYGLEVLDVSDKTIKKFLQEIKLLLHKINQQIEAENPQEKLNF